MTMIKSQEDIYIGLINRLGMIYQSCDIYGKKCFLRHGGGLFAVDQIRSFGAFVIEYADSVADAELNRYEDGDLHYLNEQSEEMLFRSIIQEIEELENPSQD